MEKIFEESGYTFDFTRSIAAYKADAITYHDLSSVDFVVETTDNFIFVEIKNPDNKKADEEKRIKSLSDLKNCFYPFKIADKYKNMLLRKWAKGDTFNKPVLCVFILEFQALSKTDRAGLKERIFNRLPFTLNKPEFGGKKIFEKRFELLSINEFIEKFPDFRVVAR